MRKRKKRGVNMAKIRRILGTFVAAYGLWITPGWSQFSICNQTFDVVNVAIGAYERDSFETSGWWTFGPNQCANVIDETLRARYFYVFAQDVFGRVVLSGATPMCIAPDRFVIKGETDCLIRGHIEARFHEVDTLRSERWTLFVYPPAN